MPAFGRAGLGVFLPEICNRAVSLPQVSARPSGTASKLSEGIDRNEKPNEEALDPEKPM